MPGDPIIPIPTLDFRNLKEAQMPDTTAAAPAVKPGYMTSEFWLTAAATVLTLLVASGVIPTGSPVQGYVTEILFGLGALGYHAGRVITKASAAPDAPVDPVSGRAV